ncbi:hypothetical protein MY3296_003978 [Beauveria thailandica]
MSPSGAGKRLREEWLVAGASGCMQDNSATPDDSTTPNPPTFPYGLEMLH